MLKISELQGANNEVVLQLEGKVSDHWVEEMQRICHFMLDRAASVRLDLSDVTFADRSGVRALVELKKKGVALVNCSGFLVEQLKTVQDE
jgi:anti-anti-sigma regulatory factor